jgi:photosystem II stability/assembly factor-like uncharacterized protein
MIQTKKLLFLLFSVIAFFAKAQWQSQNTTKGIDFSYVSAVDKHHVYTMASKQDVGSPFDYHTYSYVLDSATNIWKSNIQTAKYPTEPSFPFSLFGLTYVSKNIGYVSDSYFGIYKTTDAGHSWTKVKRALIFGVCFDLKLVNNTVVSYLFNGYQSDNSYQTGIGMIKSSSIREKATLSTSTPITDVHFLDTLYGIGCGGSGSLIKTQNGGDTWQQLNSGVTTPLNAIHFISKQVGFVIGDAETILKTINGGISWQRISYKAAGNVYRDVKFVSPKIGYICGDFGTIMKTIDGGNTWKAMQTGTYETLNQLAFPDSLNGWAVGTNGTILYLNEDKNTPKVQTVTPSDTFMCTTGTYSVQFAVNKKFNTGNLFTAQLSDGQGNWGSPQTLGTLVSDTSGSINFTLGKNQVLDGGYRIRIVSSAPAQTSVQTQSPLSVDVGTPSSVSITSQNLVCEGSIVSLTAQYTNSGFDPSFQWFLNGSATNTGTSFSSTTLKKGDKISFQMTSSADCPVPKRPITNIDAPITPVPSKPSISQIGNTLFSSANAGNQWELNGSPVSGAVNSQYSPAASGSYRVKVKDGNCESEYSDVFPFIITGAEASRMETARTTIYPVPCTNELHFQTNISVQTILLKDLTGRILWQENGASQNTGTLEVATIPSGIYYLELLGSNGKQDRKTFLKQ